MQDSIETGSSPRVRGTPDRAAHNLAEPGIIPACAGNTAIGSPPIMVYGDHPRVCGEHTPESAVVSSKSGSSPRVRGTPRIRVGQDDVAGIIPACAGNTSFPCLIRFPGRDHPRVCGEHQTTPPAELGGEGSSPRVRGTPGAPDRNRRLAGIIPACAGNTWLWHGLPPTARDHPRVCGEHSMFAYDNLVQWGSSPRVRGTRG